MCPYCGQFDQANSADLDALVQEDGVTIDYRPLSFLDGNSKGTHYSTRAGNALAVVADQDGEHFTAFLTALYANQPAEGSEGLTDDEIADLAVGVGVPQDVADQFLSVVDGTFTTSGSDEEKTGTWRTFAPWIMAATSQADTDLGGISTPTVLIDGQDWPADGEDKSQLYVAGPSRRPSRLPWPPRADLIDERPGPHLRDRGVRRSREPPVGFEPTTCCLQDSCSGRLS